ncbi:MAG: zinc-dependent alcohol dehydrogenase family protein [Gemmataceae bacterium]|nr:zinc-dependent alcohol dehydrogenase family protein [Gemmataceae bacterium]
MKAVVFEQFGEPAEVLRVHDVSPPSVGQGQVLVRMLAAPINPSDLLVVRGRYGKLPRLPATPGFEGVGIIEAVGPGWIAKLRGLRPGRRVAVLNGQTGNWCERVVVNARQAVPVADDLSDDQVASFFVNPATALAMTRWVLRIPAGSWLLQTAAASALGQMVVRLARHDGYRTINVVRRREQVETLRQMGGDEVICTEDETVEDRVRAVTNGRGVVYALDAVGGAMGGAVVRSLGPGGRLLVYGTLSGEPIPLDPRSLMVGHKTIEGFWLAEWVRQQGVVTMLKLFRTISRLLAAGVLTTPVQATFPLEEITAAVRAAESPGRFGKIMLRIGNR